MPITLNYRERLPKIVREEFDQLVASLQELESRVDVSSSTGSSMSGSNITNAYGSPLTTQNLYFDYIENPPNPGVTTKGVVQLAAGGNLNFANNLRYVIGSGWHLDDPAKPGCVVVLNQGQYVFYTATAGANPRTLNLAVQIVTDGTLKLHTGSFASGRVGNVMMDHLGALNMCMNLRLNPTTHAAWEFETAGQPGSLLYQHYDGRLLYLYAPAGASVALGQRFLLSTTGDITIPGSMNANAIGSVVGYYEYGRTTPLGSWIDVAYAAGNYVNWTVEAADQQHLQYMRIGKTMWMNFGVQTATAVATNNLHIIIPGGVTVAQRAESSLLYYNGAWGVGTVGVTAGFGYLYLRLPNLGNWVTTANGTYAYGTLCFPTTT